MRFSTVVRFSAACAFFIASFFIFGAPPPTYAATTAAPLEISGWMPYWRGATSTADVAPHLSDLKEVDPFGYTVKSDGSLVDLMHVDQDPWASFIAQAKAQKVRVIPTVMWSDTNAIDTILRSATKRRALEQSIADLVKQNNFDGIDIDFEAKKAADKAYFSLFLQGLYQRMGTKFVMCTIEARTPPDSAYSNIPTNIEYANDYVAINKYCDRVRIMTYDQEQIDIKLNAANNSSSSVYTPISDPAWVEKVVNYAAKTISRKKIVIGIPTYGYEYDVRATPSGFVYDLLWAFNPQYALNIAQQYGIQPKRNAAGEMSFSYMPNSTPAVVNPSDYAPAGTSSADIVSAGALAAATTTNTQPLFNVVWWSDASAINDKIALAKKLGVRGVAIFKFDGGEDPNMWTVIHAAAAKK